MQTGLVLLSALLAVLVGVNEANAAPPTATITVEVFGSGAVTSAPSGIACPDDCTQTYSKKTAVVLTAAPGSNYVLAGWTGACSGAQATCTLTVASNVEVAAVFEQQYPAPISRTGQTTVIAAGDDGDLQAGVPSPTPRFIDNGDTTVTDRLTGLTWMKDMGAFPELNWPAALTLCNSYSVGTLDDWRLPNIKEVISLLDFEQGHPMLPLGHPFTNVPLNADGKYSYFWTSTTNAVFDTKHDRYGVDIDTGDIRYQPPAGGNALCVRGGY